MRLITITLVALCVLSPASADEQPLTAAQWNSAHQEIGAKFNRGMTTAQTSLRREQLLNEIAAMKATPVKLTASVKDVRWKDGIAQVYTTTFLPEPEPGTAKPPLKIIRTAPIELRMDAETAATIEPGAPVTFQGTLNFQKDRYGAVGRALKAQQMHTLSHNELKGTPLGTYTSSNCVITIDDKEYPSRWASR